jgi:hypothetical protein
MAEDPNPERQEILLRLAQSRAEIRDIFEPPSQAEPGSPEAAAEAAAGGHRTFPRSRTMKLLTSGRGLGTVGAMVGGLLMARPALALRLMRWLPVEAVARVVLVKAITAMRSKR